MSVPAPPIRQFNSRRGKQALMAVIVVAIAAGLLKTDSVNEFTAYVIITLAALAPSALWLRMGAPGIPVLPTAGAMYYLYYALPILTGNLGNQTDGYYSPEEILAAAFTVTLFVVTATLCWWLVMRRTSGRHAAAAVAMSRAQMNRLIYPGLVLGLAYYFAVASGNMSAAGLFSNVLRSIAVSALLVFCYTLGYGRAHGILTGRRWLVLVGGLCAIIILASSTLFLIDGLTFAGVAGAGYTFTSKRIPWRTVVPAFALVLVLHAGKGEMREKYWGSDSPAMSITAVPQRLAEWLSTGVANLTSGETKGQSIVERASLFWLLLRVQRLTPDYVPYLGGETYALLPQMILPRFISENKIASQSAITLLNVRYGFQSVEAAQSTAIGWGLIAEAFANFGNFGVIGVAMYFGLLAGFLMRGSIGQQAVSLPSLLAVAALNSMINLEWDFSYFTLNTGQAVVSLTILYVLSFAGLAKKNSGPQMAERTPSMTPPMPSPRMHYPANKRRFGAPS
ncbi:MAG: hypothetical protein ABSD08_13355 [Xanthobacteraceae bacterium]|jgi:hypothetical protein